MAQKKPQEVSGKELAEWLSLTPARITQLTSTGVLQKNPKSKKYLLKESVAAYCQDAQGKKRSPVIDEYQGMEFTSHQERKHYFDSEHKKDDVLIRRQQLLPASDVSEAMFTLIEIIRDSLLVLPDAYERDTGADPQDVQMLERWTENKLKTLENETKRVCKSLGFVE